MFFRRNEHKSHNPCVIIGVAALTMIGAASITKWGKGLICTAAGKVQSCFDKTKKKMSSEMSNVTDKMS